MKVIGYARVSGKSQVDGDGFPRQNAAVLGFCQAHVLQCQDMFQEEGVSGTVEGLDRPAFAEMLTAISDPNSMCYDAKAIVVERMDRLARDLMVSEVLLSELRQRGIKVFSADQGQCIDMASDGGDPTRVLIRQIMGALAQWEKTMLVKKLRAAKDRMKAQGKYAEGTRPYGDLPGERVILQFMLANHPDMNYSQIAGVLRSSGDTCLNRSKRFWTEQNVRMVIVNHKKRNK